MCVCKFLYVYIQYMYIAIRHRKEGLVNTIVSYRQPWAFDRPHLSYNDHCDCFQEMFLLSLFHRNSFECGLTDLWIMPEPATPTTQNHPELARATQESARAS